MNRSVPLLFLIAGAGAANAQDCASIADDQERLACYDALSRGAEVPAAPLEAVPAAAEPATKVPEEAPPPAVETEPVVVEGGDDFGMREYEPDPTKEYIEATIVEVRKAGTLEYIRLDNGQVWREIEHTRMTFKEGRRVTITEGIMNSFDLQMEGLNKIVKVKRVQ